MGEPVAGTDAQRGRSEQIRHLRRRRERLFETSRFERGGEIVRLVAGYQLSGLQLLRFRQLRLRTTRNVDRLPPCPGLGPLHLAQKLASPQPLNTAITTQTAMIASAIPSKVTVMCPPTGRSEEHTSELQSLRHLVCRL